MRFGDECVLLLSKAMLPTAPEMAGKRMQLLFKSVTSALKYALESGLPLGIALPPCLRRMLMSELDSGFGGALCAGSEAESTLGNLLMGERSRDLQGTGPALSTEEFSPAGVLVLFREIEFICVL